MKTVKDLINQKEQQLNSKLKNIVYIKVKDISEEGCKENRIELTDTKLKELLTEDEYSVYQNVYYLEGTEDYEVYEEYAEVYQTLDGEIETNEELIIRIIEGNNLPVKYEDKLIEEYRIIFNKVKECLVREITQDILVQGKVINELIKLSN